MRVLLYTHDSCLLHDNGPGHPERPERIPAAIAGVHASGLTVDSLVAPEIELEQLSPVHDPTYVAAIQRACESGGMALDQDTSVVADSWEAALRSAGAGLAATDALRAGEGDLAFIATRPPGHHALHGRAMGFCLFNNIAVAADSIARSGETVAIVDWDVHHGNGTQDLFYDREDILYLSIHQFPFYPGTGWIDEVGAGSGRGHTINVPLPSGSSGVSLQAAVEAIAVPVLEEFDPDWILVSAGYDAHTSDPLAGLAYSADDYGWAAKRLLGDTRAQVVMFLEGGYDLEAIESSVTATLRGSAGESFASPAGADVPGADRMVAMAADRAAEHWPGVQAI